MRAFAPFIAVPFAALMLAVGAASPSNAAPAVVRQLKVDSTARAVVDVRYRRRAARLYLPIAPNYSAYDYPYYFARGYYPTHIAPGYIYYGRPYAYYGSPYAYYGSPYAAYARPYPYYGRPYRHRVYARRGVRFGRW